MEDLEDLTETIREALQECEARGRKRNSKAAARLLR
jgi:hypothetical protein